MPLPPPNLTPRRGLFWLSLAAFTAWVGLLTWVYLTQVVMKRA